MSAIMWANVALTLVNGLLALVVAGVYLRNHQQIKSPFTLSLVLFAVFFVVHNGVLLWHYLTMMDKIAGETFVLVEGALQLAALGALAYATLR